MIQRSRGEKIFNVVNLCLLGFLGFVTLYPFLYTVSISLSTQAEASREGLHVIPGNPDDLLRAVKEGFRGQWAPKAGPFTADEIEDPARLALDLAVARDEVSRYLRTRFEPATLALLEAQRVAYEQLRAAEPDRSIAPPPAPPALTEALVAELDEALHDEQLFVPPGASPFAAADLREPAAVARKLQAAPDEVSQFIRGKLPPAMRQRLDAWRSPDPLDQDLTEALADALEAAARDEAFYTPQRFARYRLPDAIQEDMARGFAGRARISLQRRMIQSVYTNDIHKADEMRFAGSRLYAEAAALAEKGVIGDDLIRLNRVLLQSAYPGGIRADLGVRGNLREFTAGLSLSSYTMVFQNPAILIGYANTLFRTIVGTLLTLVFTCIAAYPLSRRDMPHRGVISFLILFTMIFSGGLVPSFLLIKGIGLYNSRWVYVIPGLLSAFNIIIVKNFFQSIPDSLYEAATIDGASEWRTLFQIFIPLSKPVLATVGLWTAVAHWNMWFDAMIFIDDASKQVMQTYLQRIVIENNTDLIEKGLVNPDVLAFTSETIKAATTIVTILPILIVYPFVQRYFVKGILIGAVTGYASSRRLVYSEGVTTRSACE